MREKAMIVCTHSSSAASDASTVRAPRSSACVTM